MNIEDIENMKWNYAYMKLMSEYDDSYFFGFDIDTKTDLMKGRMKISKSVFVDILKRDIDSEFAVQMVTEGQIEFIEVSSRPIIIDDSVKEIDFWGIVLSQKFFEKYKDEKKIAKVLLLIRRKEGGKCVYVS